MTSVKRALRSIFSFDKNAVERQLALLCLVLAVGVRLWDPAPIELLRLKTFDLYQWLMPWEPPAQTVTIIDIDEESLAEVGQWPWPRTIVADLVNKLTAAGVVAIGFDIVFPEPDRMSAPAIAKSLESLDPDISRYLLTLPNNDTVLADAIRNSRVVLGQSGIERVMEGQFDNLKTTPLGVIGDVGDDPKELLFNYPGIVRNIPVLEQAALGLGMIVLGNEPDGIARRVTGVMRVGDHVFPTLSIELLRIATGHQNALGVKANEAGIESLVIANIAIPTDSVGRLWVHFAPHDRERYVSAKDVLAGTAPAEKLAGKLVIVGTSAIGIQDIRPTPLQLALPGVEVHALLLENILAKHFLVRPNYILGAEMLVIVLSSFFLIAFVPVWSAMRTLAVGTAGAAAYMGAVFYYYWQEAILVDLTYPMLATFSVYIILAYLNYIREEAQKREIRNAFSHYMSPALVEELAGNPDKLKLGGETKDLSLLFCDIRGFTAISEQYDAQGLTRVINRFLTPMTGIILDRQGTIDKYIGDCIMAFWNAPLDDPDHREHACQAALTMIRDLEGLNETWRGEAEQGGQKFAPIRIGIGVNSGVCAVGNMGSDQRFDYSVLGDDVNLASRLEGQTKAYGVDIIIGENTRERAQGFACLELDLVRVKGKARPVRIYALLGDPDQALENGFRTLAEQHEALLAAYREQDWGRAQALTADCAAAASRWTGDNKLDALYDMYRSRIADNSADPPPPDWDGVYDALSK